VLLAWKPPYWLCAFDVAATTLTLVADIYVARNYRPARIFPVFTKLHIIRIICQKSPVSFPLLSFPESTVIEVFLVSVVYATLVLQFPRLNVCSVPRGHDIGLTM